MSATKMVRYKAMIKAVVIGLGALIVALSGVLVAGVLDRLGDTKVDNEQWNAAVALPTGSRVVSITSDDSRLSLLLEFSSGSQAIMTIDALTGEVLSTFELFPRR